jgi:hypothetical protein
LNFQVKMTPSYEWKLNVDEINWDFFGQSFHRQLRSIDELMKLVYNAAQRRWSPCKIADTKDKNRIFISTWRLEAICSVTVLFCHCNDCFKYPKSSYLCQAFTTITVLVSAIQKLAREEKIPQNLKLYHGLGGTADLPGRYLNADSHGQRGFLEWGFMLTNSEWSIAVQYSGIREVKPLPYVFEFCIRTVHRGACIKQFSQYPQEIEFLFAPCSFWSPTRCRVMNAPKMEW